MGRSGDAYGSPDEQRRKIARWAELHEVTVSQVEIEEDVSGNTKAADRKLGELIEAVEAGTASGIVCRSLDRFGRNLAQILANVERLAKADGWLYCIEENIDSRTEAGQIQIALFGILAEIQRKQKAAYWGESVGRAIERGVYPVRAPFAYETSQVWDAKREEYVTGPLVPTADGHLVTEVFKLRAQGASYEACAEHIRQARGSFSRTAVMGMLSNPAYRGHIVHPLGSLENAHPALIDQATFDRAQDVKADRAARLTTPKGNGMVAGKGVLLGLVTCEACGRPMTIMASGIGKHRDVSYTCRKTWADMTCTAPASARVKLVDALVVPELEARVQAGGIDLEAMLVEVHDAQVAQAEAQRMLTQWMKLDVDDVGEVEWKAEQADRRQALRQASDRLTAAYAAEAAVTAPTDQVAERREQARQLLASVTIRPDTEKRGRWGNIADRVTITWRDAA